MGLKKLFRANKVEKPRQCGSGVNYFIFSTILCNLEGREYVLKRQILKPQNSRIRISRSWNFGF